MHHSWHVPPTLGVQEENAAIVTLQQSGDYSDDGIQHRAQFEFGRGRTADLVEQGQRFSAAL